MYSKNKIITGILALCTFSCALSMDKKNTQENIQNFFKDNKESWLKGYLTVLATSIGHELGHASLPYIYKDKFKIMVTPWCTGYVGLVSHKLPKKLLPIVIGLGPIAGIATSFGVLKASNIYHEYKREKDLKKGIYQGLKKRIMNEDQNFGLRLGAFMACGYNALQYSGFKGSDGQMICKHFNLSSAKSFCAQSAMTLGALGLVQAGFAEKSKKSSGD